MPTKQKAAGKKQLFLERLSDEHGNDCKTGSIYKPITKVSTKSPNAPRQNTTTRYEALHHNEAIHEHAHLPHKRSQSLQAIEDALSDKMFLFSAIWIGALSLLVAIWVLYWIFRAISITHLQELTKDAGL